MNNIVEIYPNPTRSTLNIKMSENISENYNFKLVDNLGRIIYEQQNLQPLKTYSINLSQFPKGLYLALVKTVGITLIKKILLD